jgi:hypothetical protein
MSSAICCASSYLIMLHAFSYKFYGTKGVACSRQHISYGQKYACDGPWTCLSLVFVLPDMVVNNCHLYVAPRSVSCFVGI